jgi:hypothetical protein
MQMRRRYNHSTGRYELRPEAIPRPTPSSHLIDPPPDGTEGATCACMILLNFLLCLCCPH